MDSFIGEPLVVSALMLCPQMGKVMVIRSRLGDTLLLMGRTRLGDTLLLIGRGGWMQPKAEALRYFRAFVLTPRAIDVQAQS